MRRASIPGVLAIVVLAAASPVVGVTPGQAAGEAPRAVTVPFELDHNRMIVELELVRSDGTTRTARAWVDTGSQTLMLAEPLAGELGVGVKLPPEQAGARGAQVPAPRTPALRLAGLPLSVDGVATVVRPGARVMPGVPAEANLPASALRRHHVVLDYPAGTLTVARPKTVKPPGVAVPCQVHPATGLVQVVATVGGEAVPVALDNGSSYTWVSRTVTQGWARRHVARLAATGAVGCANFFGFDLESGGQLARLPELSVGPLTIRHVGALGLEQGFFDWYSGKTAAPVVGFLGANVLRGFRLDVDFPGQMTYWQAGEVPGRDDLDTVGLTLRPETDGRFTVVGVSRRGGTATVAGVRAGDVLLQVDGLQTSGATMGQVAGALRGVPGARRQLVLERAGERQEVNATVERF